MARLFVAIEIPIEVRERLAASWEHPGLRRTAIENMHLTLAFLGEADPDSVEDALKSRTLVGHPLTLGIQGWGTFPRSRAARVLWAGVSAGPELGTLVEGIRELVGPFAPQMDSKPFAPHITLARAREPLDLSNMKLNLPTMGWTAESFVLVESKIGRPRAIYRTVGTFCI